MRHFRLTTEAFSTPLARRLTGISRQQLVHWDRKGIVKPSKSPAAGRGSKRLYSYKDLLALKAVKNFRDQGVSLQKIAKCVRYLRGHLPDISQPLGFLTLLTDGETIHLVADQQTLIDTVKNPGQRAWMQLSISAIDRELRRSVIGLRQKRIEEIDVGDQTYQVEIEAEPDGEMFVATVAGLRGCITQGETEEELRENIRDAIACREEARRELAEEGISVPRGKTKRRSKFV